jgi:phage-related protein
MRAPRRTPVIWVGSARKDLQAFPAEAQRVFGYALHVAQIGGRHPSSKTLKGFGSGVVEVLEDHDGDTFRLVYTVRLKQRIYVLHAFQKRSKHGIATPRKDLELIKRRLRDAEELHRQWLASQEEIRHEQEDTQA